MTVSGPLLQRSHRFAMFWGGGLGDILTLRPLLIGLETALDKQAHFFTTATHLPDLFSELGLATHVQVLPARPAAAYSALRKLGISFDWLYLGPYPRLRTRMLAAVVGAQHVWSRQHTDAQPFIGEQVLADIRALGLTGPDAIRRPYGGRWDYASPSQGKVARPYLVLHAGAKDRWETTRWPDERWAAFLRRLLERRALEAVLVGVPGERDRLERLCGYLGPELNPRVRIETGLDLSRLAALLDGAAGVVCHNSGVLHLAAMLDRPTVALTGSSARFWRPPYAHVLNLTSGACELACNQYRCPVPFYRARCIRELDVDAVLQAVDGHLLKGG